MLLRIHPLYQMEQFSITKAYEADYRIKGSKFLAFLKPCNGVESIDESIEDLKSLHPTATHHCYACRIDPGDCMEFRQDDGEPAGTAGFPILNELKSARLVNSICIVVRYYGGTKLGKSGLIDAYSSAARLAIDKAMLRKITPTILYSITYVYDQQALIDKLKHTFTLYESGSEYTDNVQLVVACPLRQQASFEKYLEGISHLMISVEKKGRSIHIKS
ncbi:IMPACT family protein [soil metagenome]